MKKLFSFISVFALAAILGFSTVSAQTTTLTVEKLWSITEPTGGAARQGFGMDGALYYHKNGEGVYKVTAADAAPELVISKEATGIGAHSVAKDDAGNIVVFGSAGFPTGATSELFIYVQKKGEATGAQVTCPALEGFNRTDFIAAAGDVFSAEGGHLYLINNNGAAAFDITIVNGATATVAPIAGMTLGASQNAMMDVHDGIYHYASAGSGVYSFDGTTATKVDGLTDIQAQCLGTTHFTLAGKELWAYHVGGNYTSEFKVLNKTDNAFVTDKEGNALFVLHDASKASGGALRGVWLNTEKIDDNNYLLYAWHSHDGGAVYKVSAVVAATVTLNVNDAAMGSVEGAGDYAVGGNATVKAIPALGHSFVAWKNGDEVVSTDAEYTFAVTGDVTLTAEFQAEENKTLTLAVNDPAMGNIALPEGIVLGENSVAYGTVLTLTAVPAEGITFSGWYNGDALYAKDYTIEVAVTADLALTAKFTSVLVVEYVLNGGITNDFGWTSKGAVALELQEAYNAAYSTTKAWAKEENGYIYYNLGGEWVREDQVPVGTACTVAGFIQNVTYNTTDNLKNLIEGNDKYAWLNEIIVAARAAAGLTGDLSEAIYRKELSAFFLCAPAETSWPAAASYEVAGTFDSFKNIWKHGFANPTEIVAEVTLNAPYHPELTFYGWYATEDFSGEKVTTLSPQSVIPGGKLYAKIAEYIPTIEEVLAMEEGTETKVSGVVNWARGGNVFIQDATGGFLVYNKDLAATVGTKIIVKGTRGSFNGKPQLSNAVIESTEKGELFPPVETTLSALLADTTSLKYFGQRVQVLGVHVAEYDSYGNLWVSDKDGSNKIQCYYMTPDQTKFPVGKKISLTAVASSNKGVFQFEGDIAGLELVIIGKKDAFDYPVRGEKGQYTLTNNWVISNMEGNYAANKPGANDYVRGMAAKDGIMYFINREDSAIVRVDGATGEMLNPIKLKGEHLFEKATVNEETGETTWSAGTTLPFNDIKFDWAGNCVIGACMTGATVCQTFFIYVVDLETGECTKLIEDVLWENPGLNEVKFRFDAFGVAGDVTKNGVIMAADANGSWNVYRWLVTDGVAGEGEQVPVLLDPAVDQSLFINAAGYGTAPQIFPQDEEGNLFYVDGFNTLPMLFYGNPEEGAVLVDDFIYVPTGVNVWNNPGDTIAMNANFNGLVEFQVGEEYFLLMAATNNEHAKVKSSYALYKFADDGRLFEGMEPLWYFPKNGLGTTAVGCRTAVPSVDVIDDNTAVLYLYTTNNGYAAYTLKTNGEKAPTSLEELEVQLDVQKVVENGQVFIMKGDKKFNILGAEVK